MSTPRMLPRLDSSAARANARSEIVKRDGSRCCWCAYPTSLEPDMRDTPHAATIEHLRPLTHGGTNRWPNLAIACYECNHKRGHRLQPPPGKRGGWATLAWTSGTAIWMPVGYNPDHPYGLPAQENP